MIATEARYDLLNMLYMENAAVFAEHDTQKAQLLSDCYVIVFRELQDRRSLGLFDDADVLTLLEDWQRNGTDALMMFEDEELFELRLAHMCEGYPDNGILCFAKRHEGLLAKQHNLSLQDEPCYAQVNDAVVELLTSGLRSIFLKLTKIAC